MATYQNMRSSSYYLRSSDSETYRAKDSAASAARDLSRTTAYGKSAARTVVDNVVGAAFRLTVEADALLLGVTSEQAQEWELLVKAEWHAYAEGMGNGADARRQQQFSGLMRTAFASYFVSGEALASVEFKRNEFNEYGTCYLLHDPERLSDPRGEVQINGTRRMGVEQDRHGAPIAYWLRRSMPSDMIWQTGLTWEWDRYARYTGWGRPRILHAFEHDRPAMTRGLSAFTTAIDPLARHDQYVATELEAAAVRAMFAATLTSELNYEDALNVLGPDQRQAIQANGAMSLALQYMTDRLQFYGGQDLKIGKAKVTHLLPNEKLDTKSGNQLPGVLKEFSTTALYQIASALGVDFATLTKDYSATNYSGARVAMAEIEKSYAVRRTDFISQFAAPAAWAWLEEAIVVRRTIPMLGNGSFYERRGAVSLGFSALGRVPIDPLKEAQARAAEYNMGATSLRDICTAADRDWKVVLDQRAREKAEMARLGLKPEDINPELIMNAGGDQKPKPDNSGSNK